MLFYDNLLLLLLSFLGSTLTAFGYAYGGTKSRDHTFCSSIGRCDNSHASSCTRIFASNVEESSVASTKENEEEAFEFPPPLTGVERIQRAATFWTTCVPIVANYYGILSKIKLQEVLGSEISDDQIEKLWNDQHEDGAQKIAETITELKGFYVKTAQIISQRQDLFPKQYTDALSGFTDNLDPMPVSMVKNVIKQDLLLPDESFEDVFSEFDEIPLGAASVAQVHRAVLTEKYGGPREVAVKVQRPSIEDKLMGDVANLKTISYQLRNVEAMPLDYYTVFAELEKQLAEEFDFVAEGAAMERIYNSLERSFDGTTREEIPVVIPRVVPGLISRRVLVQDFLKGVPLSRAREEMLARGIDPQSPESILFGRNLLQALTKVFGRTILETGFFHADPHPGNIFILDDGRIGLIDYGQVKQISGRSRETLAKVMVALAKDNPDQEEVGKLAIELGVTFNDDAKPEAPAAVAFWLFDGMKETLPGGYDKGELSPNSPLKELKAFPQDLVLVGRSTILIKALSGRLNIPWSLAKEWAPIGKKVLEAGRNPSNNTKSQKASNNRRVRFREVWNTLKLWTSGKAKSAITKLPSPIRSKVASLVLKLQERKQRRKERKKERENDVTSKDI